MSGEPQVGFRFQLVHPEGQQEVFLVDAERALIGSGAHCEVRLPPEIAALEHVEVFASDRVIHFATRPLAIPVRVPMLGGVPMVEGRWEKGAVLALGNVQLTVTLVDLAAPKAKPPFWALLLLIPVVGIGVTAVTMARAPRTGDPPIPEAPALLPPKQAATCPNVAADQRVGLAAEKLRIALAKRERSPFSPQDGFEAVAFFETAAACYQAAAQPGDAAQADHAANLLRAKLDEEYRMRRVRLEHAYKIHDPWAVKRELAVLLPMTSQHRGPYTEWLAALDRAASAELDQVGRLQP